LKDYVLDASAILAVLNQETGSHWVEGILADSCACAANIAEVYGKLAEEGFSELEAEELIDALAIDIVPLDAQLARAIGSLRPVTKELGLSLGDRSCLALATKLGAIAVTADQVWKKFVLCPVKCIR